MALSKLSKDELKKMSKTLKLNNGENDCWGKYWTEFRIKDKNNGNKIGRGDNEYKDNDEDKKMRKDANDLNLVPLRWPCNLYGVTVPFDFEKKSHESLKVHHKIFTRYWTQENVESSAILRFQFSVHLS